MVFPFSKKKKQVRIGKLKEALT